MLNANINIDLIEWVEVKASLSPPGGKVSKTRLPLLL